MNYSQHDIVRYLREEMTFEERFQFEKAMLDDPFLSDAVEGASNLSPDKLNDALDEIMDRAGIKPKTNESVKRMKQVPFSSRLAIAASLGIILIIGSVFFLSPSTGDSLLSFLRSESNKPNSGPTETQSIEPQTKSESTRIHDDNDAQELDKEEMNPPTDFEVTEVEIPPTNQADLEPENSDEILAQASANLDTILTDNELQEPISIAASNADDISGEGIAQSRDADLLVEEESSREKSARSAAPAEAFSTATDQIQEDFNPSLASGFVTDQNGSPIIGVNVILDGTTIGVVTDSSGQYSLPVESSTARLNFSFIGFEDSFVVLNGPGKYDIVMEEAALDLAEVVVMSTGVDQEKAVLGYNTGRKTEREVFAEVHEFAEPKGGKQSFNRYIRDNRIHPQSAIDNNISGRVVLEFNVLPGGELAGFEVTKGLGFGCDEEAIRLVREGPGWNPATIDGEEITERVSVSIKFPKP